MLTDRKLTFKVPPAVATNQALSQELRRNEALAEQKRRRARKVDLCRQLDLFAGLSLGHSDDDEDSILPASNGRDFPNGIAEFAPLLDNDEISDMATAAASDPTRQHTKGGRGKHRRRQTGESRSSTKWADRCMYAELLEMKDVDGSKSPDNIFDDGLPSDLETSWVAVGPVPIGKRCLAVTYQTSGIAGTVPNTALRSRVKGKTLLPPFPSSLPPSTMLDCILDVDWRNNGILHVLDIIQYKGQNVGDCETAFRFWWRDTRLAELPRLPPPSRSRQGLPMSENHTRGFSTHSLQSLTTIPRYNFSYPNTLLPVPYHTNTTLRHLTSHIIPFVRMPRSIPVEIPAPHFDETPDPTAMDTDTDMLSYRPATQLVQMVTDIGTDGLLLYVAEASYEPGASPLSSWIPIVSQEPHPMYSLDLFERLVYQRIARMHSTMHNLVDMDIESSQADAT